MVKFTLGVPTEPSLDRSPAEPDKSGHLLCTAATLFLREGYEATHMSLVAQSAGISKKTLYKVFASKEDLLKAVVADRLTQLTHQVLEQRDPRKTPEEELTDYLMAICGFALSPEAAGLYRLVLAEGNRFPELVSAYQDGVARGRTVLVEWIVAKQAAGILLEVDATMLAGMLVHMVIAEPLRDFVFGSAEPNRDAQLRTRVELAVTLFFQGAHKPEGQST